MSMESAGCGIGGWSKLFRAALSWWKSSDGGQFLVFAAARGTVDAGRDQARKGATGVRWKQTSPPCFGECGDGLFDEGGAYGLLGGKGEDEARKVGLAGLIEDGQPDLLAELDEGRCAEVED